MGRRLRVARYPAPGPPVGSAAARRGVGLHRSRRVAVFVTAASLLAACSGSADGDGATLLVADGGGVVLLAETGEVVGRIGDMDPGGLAFQPTWSPDGSAVAYTLLGADTATLVVAEIGADEVRLERETFPYYFSWDPDGSRLVTLRNASDEGGILVESVTRNGDTEVIDGGAPYYFDWDPDGGRYLVHVGTDRLAVVEPGSEPEPFDFAAGSFQAPSWDEGGQVYLRQAAGAQTLAVDDGGGPQDVAAVIGSAQFTAAGGRVAIQSFAVTSGNGQQAAQPVLPDLAPGAVHVVDLASGESTQVVGHNVVAFFWSPDGERLLLFDIAEPGAARWRVWDGAEIVDYPTFRPEPEWVASFLPFFDQYATSMSLWSPDGTTFAYAGGHDGDRGIWLQRIDETAPTRLADGTWVAWRP